DSLRRRDRPEWPRGLPRRISGRGRRHARPLARADSCRKEGTDRIKLAANRKGREGANLMLIQGAEIKRVLVARLNPGDDLLRSLAELVRQNEIRSGVILNGIGSLSRYHVHVVKTTQLPPGDTFF